MFMVTLPDLTVGTKLLIIPTMCVWLMALIHIPANTSIRVHGQYGVIGNYKPTALYLFREGYGNKEYRKNYKFYWSRFNLRVSYMDAVWILYLARCTSCK